MIDCPYCDETFEDTDDRPTPGDLRADHVNEEHPQLVRDIFTGEISDDTLGKILRAAAWGKPSSTREASDA